MTDVVRWLASADPAPAEVTSIEELFERVAREVPGDLRGVARAAAGGFVADRVGYAFVAGYDAAMERLGGSPRSCLCASEAGGAHPGAIQTRLGRDGALTGSKTWITLGTLAETLFVVASRGAGDDGKNRLVVVRVPRARAGVTVVERPPTPFVPEIPHAEVTFDRVKTAPDEILPGDGYVDYLKPFRTVEDLFVLAALAGYAVRVARAAGLARAWVEEALAVVTLFDALGARDPKDPATHLALAGALATARRVIAAPFGDPRVPETTRARWDRDRPLLDVAGRARALRAEAAWTALSPK